MKGGTYQSCVGAHGPHKCGGCGVPICMWGARLDKSSRIHMWCSVLQKGGKRGGTSSTSCCGANSPQDPFVPHLHALWSGVSKKGIRKRKTGRTYAGKRARAGRRHVTLVHPSFLLTSLTNPSPGPLQPLHLRRLYTQMHPPRFQHRYVSLIVV